MEIIKGQGQVIIRVFLPDFLFRRGSSLYYPRFYLNFSHHILHEISSIKWLNCSFLHKLNVLFCFSLLFFRHEVAVFSLLYCIMKHLMGPNIVFISRRERLRSMLITRTATLYQSCSLIRLRLTFPACSCFQKINSSKLKFHSQFFTLARIRVSIWVTRIKTNASTPVYSPLHYFNVKLTTCFAV